MENRKYYKDTDKELFDKILNLIDKQYKQLDGEYMQRFRITLGITQPKLRRMIYEGEIPIRGHMEYMYYVLNSKHIRYIPPMTKAYLKPKNWQSVPCVQLARMKKIHPSFILIDAINSIPKEETVVKCFKADAEWCKENDKTFEEFVEICKKQGCIAGPFTLRYRYWK